MRKLLILLLIVSAVSKSTGQNAVTILEEVNRKYTALKSYSAKFTVSGAEKYTGELLASGKKYKISVAGQEVYNNGKEVYTYVADVNEATVTTYREGDESDFSPNTIFNLYKKGYSADYKNEITRGGKKYDVITLTPKTRSSVQKIELSVGKSDKWVSSWTVHDRSGVTTYSITDFKPGVAVTEAAFTFDKSKYPKVEVIDLR